jgi:hypothetical protein
LLLSWYFLSRRVSSSYSNGHGSDYMLMIVIWGRSTLFKKSVVFLVSSKKKVFTTSLRFHHYVDLGVKLWAATIIDWLLSSKLWVEIESSLLGRKNRFTLSLYLTGNFETFLFIRNICLTNDLAQSKVYTSHSLMTMTVTSTLIMSGSNAITTKKTYLFKLIQKHNYVDVLLIHTTFTTTILVDFEFLDNKLNLIAFRTFDLKTGEVERTIYLLDNNNDNNNNNNETS